MTSLVRSSVSRHHVVGILLEAKVQQYDTSRQSSEIMYSNCTQQLRSSGPSRRLCSHPHSSERHTLVRSDQILSRPSAPVHIESPRRILCTRSALQRSYNAQPTGKSFFAPNPRCIVCTGVYAGVVMKCVPFQVLADPIVTILDCSTRLRASLSWSVHSSRETLIHCTPLGL